MSVNFPKRVFQVEPNPLSSIERRRRIEDMAQSLIDMFGDSALSVAEGQPGHRDVRGDTGIRWRDISREVRHNASKESVCAARMWGR